MDSGCNIHCSNKLDSISEYKDSAKPVHIKIGDGTLVPALGFGYFSLFPGQSPTPILYAPGLDQCLISISLGYSPRLLT